MTYRIDFEPRNGDSISAYDAGDELQSISFRAADRRFWLVCLYGAFERMLSPGDTGVARSVTDDFGNLARVASA